MFRGPEFISSVLFHHVYFLENIQSNICLTFSDSVTPDMEFRNAYVNQFEFKIEDFDFGKLFQKVTDIDKVLQLIKALLLEKKVILI